MALPLTSWRPRCEPHWGNPVKVIDWPAEKGSGGPSTEWHYDQLTVKLRQGRVVEATCIQQTCSTADSLAVGDSVTTMNAIYGPSFTLHRQHVRRDHL